MSEFKFTTSINNALEWELKGLTLSQALVDAAEEAAATKYGKSFYTLEVDTTIETIDDNFIVTFTWPAENDDESPATEEVLASFDIVTRIAGTAKLTVPKDTDVSALLQDHLDHKTLELDQTHIPKNVKLLGWNLDRPSVTLETDYVEPIEEEGREQ